MALITLEGIPDNVGKGKLSTLLKTLVFKDTDVNFWIQKFKGGVNRKAYMKFKTVEEAEKAKQMLHGFNLVHNENTYPLSCYKLQVTPVYDYQSETPNGSLLESQIKSNSLFNRDRSRSPISNSATNDLISNVDREIELIRKRRILVEEEKKLLLAKKKLQILKHLKTSDIRELQLFESVSDISSPPEIDNILSQKNDERAIETIPGFLKISRVIYSQMRFIVKKYITQENSFMLRKLINAKIKDRLAEFLKGQSYVKLQSVLGQYRLSYPVESDENLIKELWKTIEQADSQATANESQACDTTNDGQTESDINIKSRNKTNEIIEEPPELNEYVDMENDFDDWTDDEPVAKPDGDLTMDSKPDDNCTTNSVELTINTVMPFEGNSTREKSVELILETPDENTSNDVIEL